MKAVLLRVDTGSVLPLYHFTLWQLKHLIVLQVLGEQVF